MTCHPSHPHFFVLFSHTRAPTRPPAAAAATTWLLTLCQHLLPTQQIGVMVLHSTSIKCAEKGVQDNTLWYLRRMPAKVGCKRVPITQASDCCKFEDALPGSKHLNSPCVALNSSHCTSESFATQNKLKIVSDFTCIARRCAGVDDCGPFAECQNGPGASFTCSCINGYYGKPAANGSNRNCKPRGCTKNPDCGGSYEAQCRDEGLIGGNYTCSCSRHYDGVPVLNGPAICTASLAATRLYGAFGKKLIGQRCGTTSNKCASSTCRTRCCEGPGTGQKAEDHARKVSGEILALEYYFAERCQRKEWPEAFEITGLPTYAYYAGRRYEPNDVYVLYSNSYSGFFNGYRQYHARTAQLWLRWSPTARSDGGIVASGAWTLGPQGVSVAELRLSTSKMAWPSASGLVPMPNDAWSISSRQRNRGEVPGAEWRAMTSSGSWKTSTNVTVLGIRYRKSAYSHCGGDSAGSKDNDPAYYIRTGTECLLAGKMVKKHTGLSKYSQYPNSACGSNTRTTFKQSRPPEDSLSPGAPFSSGCNKCKLFCSNRCAPGIPLHV